jgi:hypothetical protein
LSVAKPELGIKRRCAGCGVKFYDLLKKPILCPKCSTGFPPPVVPAGRSRRVVEEAPLESMGNAPAPEPEDSGGDGAPDDVEIETEDDKKADDAVLIEPDEEETDVTDVLGDTKGRED